MQCPACAGTLPDNASFCHICGTPTPTSVNRTTGQTAYAPPDTERQAAERRRVLQDAVGDACEIRELIGRGGFAEVYAGWDVRLKREVAVKTIRADVSSTSLLERFQREAEAVAKLRHPHIIPIYGVGEASGVAYFTMPRISGESLAAALEREQRMSVGEACRILSEAAGALEEAHRAGVVHRDIKPENIMLEGRDRRALVMDFGIAKSAEHGERGLTGTGMVMGTPQYMSPEQAAGDRAIDHRTDQYSLAMIGYRMLAGRLPFESDSIQTLLIKQVTESPPALRSVAPDVPEPVAAAMERALAKAPEDRFESMGDFAAALSSARDAVGAGTARARREPALPKRVARMHELLPGWKHPLTIGGILGAVLFAVLMPRSMPPAALAIAGERDDAVFAARAHLAARGIAGPFATEVNVESRNSRYRFLRETIGRDSIETLARLGFPLWGWHTRARTSDGPIYHVDVAMGGRVSRFEEVVPDSASATALEPQAAESLAVAELTGRGWDLASLIRRPDSVATLRNRVDRHFTWRRPDIAVAWTGGDTAFATIKVRVTGDRVTDYSESLVLPAAYERQEDPRIFDIITVIAWLLFAALLGYAIVLAVSRQREDAVQWKSGLVLSLAVLGLLGVGALPLAATQLRLATTISGALGSMVGLAVFFAIVVLLLVIFSYASGESLAAERDLPHAHGIADLARGRLAPELATAAVAGTAIGALIAGLEGVNSFAWSRALGGAVDGSLPTVLRWGLPLPELLMNFGISILIAVAIFFVQVLVWRRRPSAWLTVLVPALFVSALIVGMDDLAIADHLVAFATTALVSLAIWRYGIIAGVIAQFIAETAWPMLAFVAANGPSFGAFVALAGLAVPLVFGRASYRRFARG